ncbi:50S ribosomal protein L11 methyltransferase [Escherichia coli]|nr:50S ribosomal protein L11 methyltransferase [Escherichia coli]
MASLTVWNSTYRKTQPEEMKADVVVANILAGPLRELAPLISVLPVSGGLLGLSGILASQAESVCEAYADSFALDRSWKKKSGAALPVVRINLRIAVG